MVPALWLGLIAAFSLPELQAATAPSVVHLSVRGLRGQEISSGSGFVVGAGGRVATNHHVIEDARGVVAVFPDGREAPALGLLADDEAQDIAILKVDTRGAAPLVLGDTRSLKVGDPIALIGSPLGYSGTLSSGIVSAFRKEGLGSKDIHGLEKDDEDVRRTASWELQHTAPSSPGASGSPVLDMEGHVVAMNVGTIRGGDAIHFAIPIERVKRVLGDIPPGTAPRPLGPDVTHNLLVSVAFFAAVVAAWFVMRRILTRRRRG